MILKLKKCAQGDISSQCRKRDGKYLKRDENVEQDNDPARNRERVVANRKDKNNEAHEEPDANENEIGGKKKRHHRSRVSVSAIYCIDKCATSFLQKGR